DCFDTLSDHNGFVRTADGFDQHSEFVAAQACSRITASQAILQALRHGNEELITGCVTYRVIYGFKIIEIEKENGQRAIVPPQFCESMIDAVAEEHAVGDFCQRIVQCLVG